jgi:catechol 2,3-dioxygenase-like lactoylglutathione lyase family enzyme
MPIELDHLILRVNDAAESLGFYAGVLGLADEGQVGPFLVLRVTPALTLQLAPWGSEGGEHLAFAMTPEEFGATFARVRSAGIAYGDSFHAVGNMQGPGEEAGAKGLGKALYFLDPSKHLIEIRCYAA